MESPASHNFPAADFPNTATDIDDDLCITVQGLRSRKHPS